MALFQTQVEKRYLSAVTADINDLFVQYEAYFKDPERQANIREIKEEQYQGGFVDALFVKLLGYTLYPNPDYNFIREQKNETDSKSADGAIVINDKIVGVVELKDHKTQDLKKVETQAFGYKNNHKDCRYIITSNFERLRFYIENAVEFIEFDLFNLDIEQFKRLWLCLSYDSISKDIPLKIKKESVSSEDQITKQLYKDYSEFKRAIFNDLVERNPQFDKLLLFQKTQKLLDRFLFVFFAEDKGLLPPNSIKRIVDQWDKRNEDPLNEYQPLYRRFRLYFNYLNEGHKGVKEDIFGYNGGLFRVDDILESIEISDDMLKRHILKMVRYDFDTEVDVNILGHIFENSLSEIEEITNEITTGQKATSKRKQDGVFYTPRYITKYIVENTIGKLCEEKKAELEINEELFGFTWKKKKKEAIAKFDAYRDWLLGLTICDPACGSGAFLNMALEFLIAEHHWIAEQQNRIYEDEKKQKASQAIQQGMSELYNIENVILENNLYGVDINEESVEIAKLALWLHTAKPMRKLTTLSNNIKCGNSLISDPEVTGDKAFDWQKEFPKVFEKGGFDVVIGNPPYVDIKQLDNEYVKQLFQKYSTAENRINLYSLFIEKGYSLLKPKGIISYINPNSMLVNSSYSKIRQLLIGDLTEIIKLPDNVFADASVETIIFTARKESNSDKVLVLVYHRDQKISDIDKENRTIFNKNIWEQQSGVPFNIYLSDETLLLLNKIDANTTKLKEIADFSLGITPYDKYKGHNEDLIKNKSYHSKEKLDDSYKPLIAGENITRYNVSDTIKEYIKYGDWLGAPRDERFFTEPRIIIRQIISGEPPRIYAGYTEKSLYFTQIGFGVISNSSLDNKYLLSLIDSKLMTFYHKYRFLDLEKEVFQKILIANCKEFPIKYISTEEQVPFVKYADELIELKLKETAFRSKFLRRIIDNFDGSQINTALNNFVNFTFQGFLKELSKQKIKLSLKQQDEWEEYFNDSAAECKAIADEIARTDVEIDRMVYELYELTPEEIEIVEKSF